MSEQARTADWERRMRRAAVTAVSRQASENPDAAEEPAQEQEDDPGLRLEQKALWVDMQVRRAIERGDFDDLPGTGKPIPNLGHTHDPDWWARRLVKREELTGLLPPALALRKEDAALDQRLDRETMEQGVRSVVEDFNHRVVEARRQLLGGPPVVTPTRDVDEEVAAWRERRDRRRERQRAQLEGLAASATDERRRGRRPRWWPRRRGVPDRR